MAVVQIEWTEVSKTEIEELPPGRLVRKEVQFWTGVEGDAAEINTRVRYFQPLDEVASSKRTFRIPNNLYRAAQEKAEESGETVSDVVRRLVRGYVADQEFLDAEGRAELARETFKRGYDAARAEAAK